jgi:hypothetical protein
MGITPNPLKTITENFFHRRTLARLCASMTVAVPYLGRHLGERKGRERIEGLATSTHRSGEAKSKREEKTSRYTRRSKKSVSS